jgi:hypothetical protein
MGLHEICLGLHGIAWDLHGIAWALLGICMYHLVFFHLSPEGSRQDGQIHGSRNHCENGGAAGVKKCEIHFSLE